MNITKLAEMKKGWFIGDFDPSLYKTKDFEIAVKKYKAGDVEKKHYHKIAKEFTLIVSGKAMMNNSILNEGDIAEIQPGEAADFTVIDDTTTVVIKIPSVKDDKYLSGD